MLLFGYSSPLALAAGNEAAVVKTNYIDDVFSLYGYTGNGAVRQLSPGFDCSDASVMTLTKCRTNTTNHLISDNIRGYNKTLTYSVPTGGSLLLNYRVAGASTSIALTGNGSYSVPAGARSISVVGRGSAATGSPGNVVPGVNTLVTIDNVTHVLESGSSLTVFNPNNPDINEATLTGAGLEWNSIRYSTTNKTINKVNGAWPATVNSIVTTKDLFDQVLGTSLETYTLDQTQLAAGILKYTTQGLGAANDVFLSLTATSALLVNINPGQPFIAPTAGTPQIGLPLYPNGLPIYVPGTNNGQQGLPQYPQGLPQYIPGTRSGSQGNPNYPNGLPAYDPGQPYIAPFNVTNPGQPYIASVRLSRNNHGAHLSQDNWSNAASFATCADTPLSSGPEDVTLYDFNADGIPDFVGWDCPIYSTEQPYIAPFVTTNPGQPFVAEQGDPSFPNGLPPYIEGTGPVVGGQGNPNYPYGLPPYVAGNSNGGAQGDINYPNGLPAYQAAVPASLGQPYIAPYSSYTGDAPLQTKDILLRSNTGLVFATNTSSAQTGPLADGVIESNQTGIRIGANEGYNLLAAKYIMAIFKERERFFSITEYTGDGTALKIVSHQLNSTPGMIWIKRLNGVGSTVVRHSHASGELLLDSAGVPLPGGFANISSYSDADVVVSGTCNVSNGAYLMMVFANDSASDSIIKTGIYSAGKTPVSNVLTGTGSITIPEGVTQLKLIGSGAPGAVIQNPGNAYSPAVAQVGMSEFPEGLPPYLTQVNTRVPAVIPINNTWSEASTYGSLSSNGGAGLVVNTVNGSWPETISTTFGLGGGNITLNKSEQTDQFTYTDGANFITFAKYDNVINYPAYMRPNVSYVPSTGIGWNYVNTIVVPPESALFSANTTYLMTLPRRRKLESINYTHDTGIPSVGQETYNRLFMREKGNLSGVDVSQITAMNIDVYFTLCSDVWTYTRPVIIQGNANYPDGLPAYTAAIPEIPYVAPFTVTTTGAGFTVNVGSSLYQGGYIATFAGGVATSASVDTHVINLPGNAPLTVNFNVPAGASLTAEYNTFITGNNIIQDLVPFDVTLTGSGTIVIPEGVTNLKVVGRGNAGTRVMTNAGRPYKAASPGQPAIQHVAGQPYIAPTTYQAAQGNVLFPNGLLPYSAANAVQGSPAYPNGLPYYVAPVVGQGRSIYPNGLPPFVRGEYAIGDDGYPNGLPPYIPGVAEQGSSFYPNGLPVYVAGFQGNPLYPDGLPAYVQGIPSQGNANYPNGLPAYVPFKPPVGLFDYPDGLPPYIADVVGQGIAAYPNGLPPYTAPVVGQGSPAYPDGLPVYIAPSSGQGNANYPNGLPAFVPGHGTQGREDLPNGLPPYKVITPEIGVFKYQFGIGPYRFVNGEWQGDPLYPDGLPRWYPAVVEGWESYPNGLPPYSPTQWAVGSAAFPNGLPVYQAATAGQGSAAFPNGLPPYIAASREQGIPSIPDGLPPYQPERLASPGQPFIAYVEGQPYIAPTPEESYIPPTYAETTGQSTTALIKGVLRTFPGATGIALVNTIENIIYLGASGDTITYTVASGGLLQLTSVSNNYKQPTQIGNGPFIRSLTGSGTVVVPPGVTGLKVTGKGGLGSRTVITPGQPYIAPSPELPEIQYVAGQPYIAAVTYRAQQGLAEYPQGLPAYQLNVPAQGNPSYPNGLPVYQAPSGGQGNASYPSGLPPYVPYSGGQGNPSYPDGLPPYQAAQSGQGNASYPSGLPTYVPSSPPSGDPNYPNGLPPYVAAVAQQGNASYPSGLPAYQPATAASNGTRSGTANKSSGTSSQASISYVITYDSGGNITDASVSPDTVSTSNGEISAFSGVGGTYNGTLTFSYVDAYTVRYTSSGGSYTAPTAGSAQVGLPGYPSGLPPYVAYQAQQGEPAYPSGLMSYSPGTGAGAGNASYPNGLPPYVAAVAGQGNPSYPSGLDPYVPASGGQGNASYPSGLPVYIAPSGGQGNPSYPSGLPVYQPAASSVGNVNYPSGLPVYQPERLAVAGQPAIAEVPYRPYTPATLGQPFIAEVTEGTTGQDTTAVINSVLHTYPGGTGGDGVAIVENILYTGNSGDVITYSVAPGGSLELSSGLAEPAYLLTGFEPQYILVKNITSGGNWVEVDIVRGMTEYGSPQLSLNLSATEAVGLYAVVNSRGFKLVFTGANEINESYIYMAIARSNKPAEKGLDVFRAVNHTGTGSFTDVNFGFSPDVMLSYDRAGTRPNTLITRGTGGDKPILLTSGAGQYTAQAGSEALFDSFTGLHIGNESNGQPNALNNNTLSRQYTLAALKRSAKVMETLIYKGEGSPALQKHNLKAVPELWLNKNISNNDPWKWGSIHLAPNEVFKDTDGVVLDNNVWGNAYPTNTLVSLGNSSISNNFNDTYSMILWSSLPDVQKVFTYNGDGQATGQIIDCAFAAGASFIIIIRVDQAGGPYVWDYARGITAGADPHYLLHNVNGSSTVVDTIGLQSVGFAVKQNALNLNALGGRYIGLAIA